jgi:hypothetical protein
MADASMPKDMHNHSKKTAHPCKAGAEGLGYRANPGRAIWAGPLGITARPIRRRSNSALMPEQRWLALRDEVL